jgi:hypothetical protein
MASQISHVVYGRKIFSRYKDKNLSWLEFLVGTVFPDIRYIAKIDRKITHDFNVSEEKIPNGSSFKIGMYVHSYVDEKRENILKKKGIYNLDLAKNWSYSTALKLVEDEIVYGKYHNWDGAVDALDTYYNEEYEYVPNKKIVEKWHNLIKRLFETKPDVETWREMILKMGFGKDVLVEVMEQAELIKNNKKTISILSETYKEI